MNTVTMYSKQQRTLDLSSQTPPPPSGNANQEEASEKETTTELNSSDGESRKSDYSLQQRRKRQRTISALHSDDSSSSAEQSPKPNDFRGFSIGNLVTPQEPPAEQSQPAQDLVLQPGNLQQECDKEPEPIPEDGVDLPNEPGRDSFGTPPPEGSVLGTGLRNIAEAY